VCEAWCQVTSSPKHQDKIKGKHHKVADDLVARVKDRVQEGRHRHHGNHPQLVIDVAKVNRISHHVYRISLTMLIVGGWIAPQAKPTSRLTMCSARKRKFADSPHALANFVTLKQLFRLVISFCENNFIEFINNS